jgi:hypothetical protein
MIASRLHMRISTSSISIEACTSPRPPKHLQLDHSPVPHSLLIIILHSFSLVTHFSILLLHISASPYTHPLHIACCTRNRKNEDYCHHRITFRHRFQRTRSFPTPRPSSQQQLPNFHCSSRWNRRNTHYRLRQRRPKVPGQG